MLNDDWDMLADSVNQGLCALVLGPEMPVDIPTWVGDEKPADRITCASALREHLRTELEKSNQESKQQEIATPTTLAAIAQQYEDSDPAYGETRLQAKARDFYAKNQLKPSEAHLKIAKLPFSVILSTCHDDLLIDAMRRLTPRKRPQSRFYDPNAVNTSTPPVRKISAKTPVIYHLFGHYKRRGSLVLSENHLLDFLIKVNSENPKLLEELTTKLNKSESLLFIGFDIEDWYLRIILKALVRHLDIDRKRKIGYALEPYRSVKGEHNPTVLFYHRGTRILICDELDLLPFVDKLNEKIEERGRLVDEKPHNDGPRVFICHASEDEELARNLSKSLEEDIFTAWVDDKLDVGEFFDEEIEYQINASDFVVVLATPNLTDKIFRDPGSYVGKEISIANKLANNKKYPFLIPLLAEGQVADNLIKPLKDKTAINLSEAHYTEDVAALADHLWEQWSRRGEK